MTEGTTLRVTSPTFSAVLDLTKRDKVWWVAPALAQMMRWDKRKVLEYCHRRGWKVERQTSEGWIEEVSASG